MENPELIAAVVGVVSGLGGLITAVTAWVQNKTENETIRNEREQTKVIRDQDSLAMHDAIEKLKFQVQANKDSIGLLFTKSDDLANAVNLLTTNVAVMGQKIDQVLDAVTDLKKRRSRK